MNQENCHIINKSIRNKPLKPGHGTPTLLPEGAFFLGRNVFWFLLKSKFEDTQ
jgi:hypothetical protein